MQPQDVLRKSQGPELDQFTQTKGWAKATKSLNKSNGYQQTNVIFRGGDPYGKKRSYLVKLGEPLPGYTGFSNRVLANNIFGKTYAECRKDARDDHRNVEANRAKNYNNQLGSHPPIKH